MTFLPQFTFMQQVAFRASAACAKASMRVMCRSQRLCNVDTLVAAIDRRARGQPLVTVANHVSVFDEPLMWSALPWRHLMRPQCMRYTLAAEEILFPNALFAWYGESARAIPVVRGNGIDQRGVDVALNVLNSGGWIHVFSEGKVNQTDQLISPFRWGVGKLVAEAQVQPIVLPIFVNGLQYTFPETARTRIPRFGYDFDFAVGDPVPDIGELRSELPTQRHTSLIDCGRAVWRARPTVLEARQVYSRITARIEQSVVELKNRIVNQSQ